ncbi:MAG: hypothetical protein HYY63_05265, partial [Elusimicrobia bacterium]|nr:hypothetical protein [Elusimicrobiota bacterium]
MTGARNTRDGVTAVNDGFGNISRSVTHQTYDLINGQAKVKTVTTSTEINNIDGSFSVKDQSVSSEVTYDYGDKDGKKGILVGAENTRDGVTAVDDGFGNISKSVTHQIYVIVNGQAKVKTVGTHSEIDNIDGSHSLAEGSVDSVVTYSYWGEKDVSGKEVAVDGKKSNTSDRKVGTLAKAVNTVPGVTVMDDGFGNRTTSTATQTYTIVNGQAKVETVTTHTDIVNMDGSRSIASFIDPRDGTERNAQDSVVTYTYGDREIKGADGKLKTYKGVLVNAASTAGASLMDDGFGNVSISTSRQTYAIINGQAKVKTVTSGSEVFNVDGSHSVSSYTDSNGIERQTQDSTITYSYWGEQNADGSEIAIDGKLSNTKDKRKGSLGKATATQGVTAIVDFSGNMTVSRSDQTY